MSRNSRRGVDGDDSLLASVAGVPLTRLARIAVCLIWAGFWAARVLFTDALYYFQRLQTKLAVSELLGEDPVDQAFSVCMVWLSVEVAITFWNVLTKGIMMLIAKTRKNWTALLLEHLPTDRLRSELERREKADQEKSPQTNEEKG